MNEMRSKDFSADGTHVDGMAKESLMLMASGTWGGGTLSIKRWSDSRGAFVTVAQYSGDTTDADEIKLGKDVRFQLELSGATTPNLNVDYWFV